MRVRDHIQTSLIETIEWTEDTAGVMIWRFPMNQRDLKNGVKLNVRDFQKAIFLYPGDITKIYGPGLYTLTKENLPVTQLTIHGEEGGDKLLRPDIYFVKTRYFIDEKWSFEKPITHRAPTYGIVRLNAHGTFDVRVHDPERSVKKVSGQEISFSTFEVRNMVSAMVLNLFPDALVQSRSTGFESDEHYGEIAAFIQESINTELNTYGLMIRNLKIKTSAMRSEN
jgi:membrane protease subunit (stomatin/prohibitin family)